MDHWDEVLPGKVLHLQYEDLVREPETEHPPSARRTAGWISSPPAFASTKPSGSVRTASAEQVRQPMYSSGVGYWKHFERELEPLRQALGDACSDSRDRRPNVVRSC